MGRYHALFYAVFTIVGIAYLITAFFLEILSSIFPGEFSRAVYGYGSRTDSLLSRVHDRISNNHHGCQESLRTHPRMVRKDLTF